MVLFNYSTKELTAKVVYYGPGLCGKTTNLQWIHEKVPIKNKGKMLSLATETDRTLFFDFLPIEIGTIRGMKTRIQLYTVPGQVFYNATRRMVLKGADCVVFVVDSQEPMLDASIESFENLKQNLEANEIDPDEIPMVLQYNKRDLPNALPIEIINERMNPKGHPFYEAVAIKGQGVEETLKGVTKLVFKSLSAKYGAMEPAAAPAPAAAKAVASAAAPPPPRPPSKPSATIPPVAPRLVPEEMLDSLDLTPPAVLEAEAEPVAVGVASAAQARSTLVADFDEAEDLRRRIRRPMSEPDYEVNLEEVQASEPVEELTLDSDPLPVFEPEAEPDASEPTIAPLSFDEPPPPSAASTPTPTPTPTPVAAAVAAGRSLRSSESAALSIEVEAGRTDVSVPIELHVETGVEQVQVNLRLVFNIRR